MEKPHIVICIGSSCFARGNAKNVEITEKFLEERGMKDGVDVELAGSLCTQNCSSGPVVIINGKVYDHVDGGVMRDLLNEYFPAK